MEVGRELQRWVFTHFQQSNRSRIISLPSLGAGARSPFPPPEGWVIGHDGKQESHTFTDASPIIPTENTRKTFQFIPFSMPNLPPFFSRTFSSKTPNMPLPSSRDLIACEDAEEYLENVPLETVSLQDVYTGACRKWGRRVDTRILAALPAALGGYEVVTTLDFSGAYIGTAGFAPLLALVICCERLETLILHSLGLRPPDIEQILEAAIRHPSLCRIDLSQNEIGTTVAKMALRTLQLNRNIEEIRVDDALVIDALKAKLRNQAAFNASIRATLPLRSFRYIAARTAVGDDSAGMTQDMLRDELQRRCEREASKKSIQEQLPYWMPAALQELSEVLEIHKYHIADVFAMFESSSSSSPEFAKVMKTLGCRFAAEAKEGEDRPFLLARALHCLTPSHAKPPLHNKDGDHRIDHHLLITALRTHVHIPGTHEDPPPLLQDFCDFLHDSRETLLQALCMIDSNKVGYVYLEELLLGITSLSLSGPAGALSAKTKEEFTMRLLTDMNLLAASKGGMDKSSPQDEAVGGEEGGGGGGGGGEDGDNLSGSWKTPTVDYAKFFAALQPGSTPTVHWEKMSASSLKALVDTVKRAG